MYRWPRGGGPPVYVPVASGGDNGIYIHMYWWPRVRGAGVGLGALGNFYQMECEIEDNSTYAHACFGSRCCTATRNGVPFARKRSSLVRCFGFVCFGFDCLGFCLGTCWLLRLLLLWLRGTGGHGSGIWNSIARSTRKEP